MIKKHFAFSLVILFGTSALAGAQPYSIEWLTQFGSSAGAGEGSGVDLDSFGNVYLSSATPSLSTIPPVQPDIWLKKYNSQGALLWSRQVGSSGYDVGNAVVVDAVGNAYVSGFTNGDLGGPSGGQYDATLTKFDPAGNALWSKQIGLRGNEMSNSVALDSLGNLIIGGYAEDDLPEFSAGTRSTMVAKFDGGGNLLWNKRLDAPKFGDSNSVQTDALGNVYVAGRHADETGRPAGYVKKLDSDGNTLWTKNIELGATGGDNAFGLALDGAGNIYTGGVTITHGGADAGGFLMKLDGDGNEQWTHIFADAGPRVVTALAVDAAGNPFLTGIISSDHTNFSDRDDVFVAKFSAAGDPLWSTTVGTSRWDVPRSLSIDGAGSLYLGGYTEGRLYDFYLPTAGNAFLIKFSAVPEPTSLLLFVTACAVLSLRRRGKRLV